MIRISLKYLRHKIRNFLFSLFKAIMTFKKINFIRKYNLQWKPKGYSKPCIFGFEKKLTRAHVVRLGLKLVWRPVLLTVEETSLKWRSGDAHTRDSKPVACYGSFRNSVAFEIYATLPGLVQDVYLPDGYGSNFVSLTHIVREPRSWENNNYRDD